MTCEENTASGDDPIPTANREKLIWRKEVGACLRIARQHHTRGRGKQRSSELSFCLFFLWGKETLLVRPKRPEIHNIITEGKCN